MILFSLQCVSCTEPSKQMIRTYQGMDGDANDSINFYKCQNKQCRIRKTAKRGANEYYWKQTALKLRSKSPSKTAAKAAKKKKTIQNQK